MAAPFDRVVLIDGGKKRDMTVAEFLAMPLHVRVGAVLQRAVDFYLGLASVDRQEALKYLRARRADDATK